MKIGLPASSLVVLVGVAGSGKSTFARRHFGATEVLSSDACRGLVCDDEGDQSATGDAFEVLRLIARRRLGRGRLTVVDATNVESEARRAVLALAGEGGRPAVAIVLDLPEGLCRERSERRPDRRVDADVLRRQFLALRDSLPRLRAEGFARVFHLSSPEEVAAVEIEREVE